jgi:hypothetical protein
MKKAFAYWWNYFWVMTIQNPKSTFSGLFSFTGLVSAGLLETLPASWKRTDFAILCVLAACKLLIKCITADTGKQLARVPGEKDPQVVTATETPTNPFAKPITRP